MQHDLERLGELTQVEPPASLDALVRERMQRVLTAQSAPAGSQPTRPAELVPIAAWTRAKGHAGAEQRAIALPLVERCVYAVGLVAYGAHALGAAARLLWRAVAG